MKINNIYVGDNLDILKTFPDNSIDSIVTDPPYGLGKEPNAVEVLKSWLDTGYHEVSGKGFMGKKWDAFVPQPIFWKECIRVLKPGGYLLSFSGTRTYDWIVMGLRLAGFEIRDQIAWLYGSGFPKSMDVSKTIDKHFGLEREVVGIGKSGKTSRAFQSVEKTTAGEYNITEASHELAKKYLGWGTALKPALEPIVMARKPLIGTVAKNILTHGVGGLNIDGCRIPFGYEKDSRVGTNIKRGDSLKYKYNDEDLEIIKELDEDLDFVWTEKTEQFNNYEEFYEFLEDYHFYKPKENVVLNFDIFDYEVIILHSEKKKVVPIIDTFKNNLNSNSIFGISDKGVQMYKGNGRFPANVIHDGSEEVENLFLLDNGENPARFFYTAKASQSERNYGLNNFIEKRHSDRNKDDGVGGDNPRNRSNKPKKNFHPTVKPIDLMRYLVRLVTPKGGVCLDPYLGSGTTAVACKAERINYIGIELEPDYVEIAEARINAEMVHYDIFDFLEE